MNRCLYCYQINEDGGDFHLTCSRQFFGTPAPPELPFAANEMEQLAEQIIRSQFAITGAQPKISLDMVRDQGGYKNRLTLVGLWGEFILKPPTDRFPELPEIEDLTMRMAEAVGIQTVPHALIRFDSGQLAYITRRIDRQKRRNVITRVHMEDMCQLTERMTEDKYRGSYEQIAKAILKHSTRPVLDVINFYEQVLFSFLTGNSDMHLKNFSLLDHPQQGYQLSPAYDMVATQLALPEDAEDLALNLNGRKRKIGKKNFISAFQHAHLESKQGENIFGKFESAKSVWFQWIEESYLSEKTKKAYMKLVDTRFKRIYHE